jgi:hypothetical protein
MQIDIAEQDTTDFDWFGVDEDGFVAHFTSAGYKRLPRSVSSSAEDLKLITEYFNSGVERRGGHLVDKALSNEVPEWKGEEHEGRYLKSFVAMADKGLFSFDIDTYVKPGIAYFRVAAPELPIKIGDLPADIQAILSRTVLNGIRLREQSKILYENTLGM